MKFSKEEIQTACKHLVTRIRNFLQSPQCREFLLFLFFVFIASAFWILHTLNEEYETEVSIPLRFKNVPENVVFTSDIPQNLNLKVSDKGTVLVKYMLGQGLMPITLDFDEFRQKGTHIRQLTSEWDKKIQSQLVVSTRIKDIAPDTLEIIYTQGQGKRVPVRIQGTPTTKRQYYLAGQDILPDSVMVYAPKSLLNTINAAYTQEADLTDIADTTHFTLPLAPVKGAKFIPDNVNVRFYADILTEKTVSVPIIGLHFPAEKQLKTFPAKVNITFQVGMQQFKEITADDFTVGVSYESLQSNPSSDHCELRLIDSPAGVSHIRLSSTSAEYLIEQKIQP